MTVAGAHRGSSRRRGLVRAAVLVGLAPACTDFEDPALVIDMRVLGMRAEPPEILTPYDPENPTAVDIDDVGTVEVCALVADPADDRALRFSMALCPPTSSGRCGGDLPVFAMGEGEVEDPETSAEPIRMCAEIDPSPDLLLVLSEAVSADDLAGFGGISAQVALRVTPEGGGDTLFAFKRVRYSPKLPDERTPNANPSVDGFIGLREPTGERGLDFPIPLGRCGEVEPFPVSPGERVTLLPDEAEGARERYVVPTFDGGIRRFTENLTYQWHATEGDWSPFESGGTIDVAGNEPPIDSTWTAPSERDIVGDGIDVRIWIVQRDERGGQAWYDTCARVVP